MAIDAATPPAQAPARPAASGDVLHRVLGPRGAVWWPMLGALLWPLYLLNLRFAWLPELPRPDALQVGAFTLLSLYLFYVALTGDLEIWNAARGEDGRASTSKFQAFLWTGAVIFGYVAVLASRWAFGSANSLPEIPANVLIALGISVGTATVAVAVTSSNTGAGRETKTFVDHKGLAPIFQNDLGEPDLGKIQLVAWTLIAVAIFLAGVFRVVGTPESEAGLPDIDTSLMVLMGLGSATYLGKKLVTTSTPFISACDRSSVPLNGDDAARTVTVTGANFGSVQAGSQITIDDVPLQTPPIDWTSQKVVFVVPPKKPDGTDWKTNVALPVQLVVGGVATNPARVTIMP